MEAIKNGLPAMPRKQLQNVTVATSGKNIPILAYSHEKVAKLIFKAKRYLAEKVPFNKEHIYHDILWHTYYFKVGRQKRPGWSGYMQTVCQGSYPGRSVVTMLPIIDMDPTNMTCIFSTLSFIANQANKLQIDTPVVTFDQPLWIKAMEIIKTTDLDIVLILGGFHMLMSFARSIGTLMSCSGLAAALETTYGPVSIKHMLFGKSIAMFLRANFLTKTA